MKQVTSFHCVASERLFSTSGNIVSDKRSCLKPERVNMLTFLITHVWNSFKANMVLLRCKLTYSHVSVSYATCKGNL